MTRLRLVARTRAVVILGLALLLTACTTGPAGNPTQHPGALRVVATTTVLADMVHQVGGDSVSVTSLVPKGGVVETFDPSPRDIATLSDADLIVMNGLGLDSWLDPVVASAAANVPVVKLGEDLTGVDYISGESGEAVNPHLWLDVGYARKYAERIAAELAKASPGHAEAFRAGGAAYEARLDDLDAWVRGQVATIPSENRKLVSFHEAFPYFAKAYGLEIVGSVVAVPGQDPSAGEVAALVDAIKGSGARAVFTEAGFNPDLSRAIADEAGLTVESNLYNDSLGDPPVDTYEGLIRWDVAKVVAALSSRG